MAEPSVPAARPPAPVRSYSHGCLRVGQLDELTKSNCTRCMRPKACAINTYSDAGAGSCTACPSNSITITTGSSGVASCLCIPGYTGSNGGPCTSMSTNARGAHVRAANFAGRLISPCGRALPLSQFARLTRSSRSRVAPPASPARPTPSRPPASRPPARALPATLAPLAHRATPDRATVRTTTQTRRATPHSSEHVLIIDSVHDLFFFPRLTSLPGGLLQRC